MNAVPEGVPVTAPNGQSLLKVRSYGLPALMEPFDRIDLIHMDIQGAELPVVAASIADLARKVRRLIIGTHSDDIHDSLVEIFRSNGFEAEFLFPRRDLVQTDYGPIQFRDGCQVWSNRNVQSGLHPLLFACGSPAQSPRRRPGPRFAGVASGQPLPVRRRAKTA